jgi:hypothetical protein
MVGKTRNLHGTVAGAAAGILCLQALPALAQETGDRASGLTFGIEQGLEVGENLGLDTPATGSSAIATTRLSLSYFDSTEVSRLAVDLGGVFRFADTPEADSGNGFADPSARLSYTRAGANAGLSLTAEASQSDLTFDRDLSDFIGEDGTLDLPDDFDLTGEGTRNTYSVAAELTLRRRAPLSFVLGASYQVTDYANTGSSTLADETIIGLDATANLRLSAISSGSVALAYDDIQTDDATETHRKVTALTFGYARELSPILRVGASLGLTHTDRTVLGPINTTENETTFRIEATRDLPNGSIGGNIGVTWPDGGGSELVGQIDWRQALPTGRISATFTQEASTTTDGETRPTTALSVSYGHDINAVSGVDFGLTYVIASGTATRNRVAESDLSVTYRRSLTEDWSLRTGLTYKTRDEETVGSAQSPFAFVSIGRTFDLR